MKHTIQNRYGLKLVIQIDEPAEERGLVFIAHGQGGFKEQAHIQAFAEAFLKNGFRVVRFDATNSVGESGGDSLNATATSYYDDLEDVINWARQQPWFRAPCALCGHSMGGMSTAEYAENHPDEVLCLAPIATVINRQLFIAAKGEEHMKLWQKQGYKEWMSRSKPGRMIRIGWGYVEDLSQHNLLRRASALTMPVLLMAGENDVDTPYEQQEILFDAIPGDKKSIVKVANADHNFRGSGNDEAKREEVKSIVSDWLKGVNK